MDIKVKLLIVDDESQILDTYKNFFQKRGFEVYTAADGEDGLKILKEQEIDVAIVDILMPKMDGMQLARSVAAERIDTSLIILTGHGDKNHAVAAINLGVIDGWFEKATINMAELLEKVQQEAQVMPADDIRQILSKIPLVGNDADE